MSAEFAISIAAIAFASMWACWKLGYDKGQYDTIKEFSDYCDRRDAEQESTQARRDNRHN